MTNSEIASVLAQIADLLEIEGENTFKVRSYQRASETIGGLGEEIETILKREGPKGLSALPGIGKSIAEKIVELVHTGQLQYYENLRAKYPQRMLDMLKIPGLGPRTAALVYRELGIGSIEELEQAAREGRLRQLPGMGAKSEEKILHNIELYRQGTERALLGTLLPIAQRLVDELRQMPQVIAAEMAGSARRRRETVGDLDILATSNDPAAVCKAFAQSDELAEVTMAGDTKVSGLLPGGRQVDLRVVQPDSYGAALVYFTGSKQHNVHLRGLAQDKGLTINEYGVFEVTDGGHGKRVAGKTEEEVYAAVGLPWIPPELREDRGEIEAALEGRLPHLITLQDIKCDLQMHTHGSDGHNSLQEMAEACMARGYTHIGITDHSPILRVANGQTGEQLRQQIEQIHELNAQFAERGFFILAGIEADILGDGALDIPEGCFEKLDFVLGSVHQGFSADADRMTERIVAALATGQVDILGHPTGRLLLEREAYGYHIDAIIEAAVQYNVALEINANPHRLDLSDIHARLAQERGALLSINTDAHDVAHLDFMQYGVMTARRGWIEPQNVINTWPLEQLKQWLRRRRE